MQTVCGGGRNRLCGLRQRWFHVTFLVASRFGFVGIFFYDRHDRDQRIRDDWEARRRCGRRTRRHARRRGGEDEARFRSEARGSQRIFSVRREQRGGGEVRQGR